MLNNVIVLQARTGSSRLPCKMILPFFNGQSILEILLNRIRQAISNVPIIVATTTAFQDDEIELLCRHLNVCCFRGSEEDVLDRFISASKLFSADKIIRVCADNIFLDMMALKTLIEKSSEVDVDYMSFVTSIGTPTIKTHYGLWAEVVKISALEHIVTFTDESLYHEHVTNYIYSHPELFKISFLPIDPFVESHSNLRLTVDTETDFKTQQIIYQALVEQNEEITVNNIIGYLDQYPDLYELMKKNIEENTK